MKVKKKNLLYVKLIFSAIGLFSLVKIIKSYGFSNIAQEVDRSGLLLVFLIFTFIPTLICYAVSWLLVSEHQNMPEGISDFKKVFIFFKFTIMSIAWNNLTPFLKVGGEPLKYKLLLKYLSPKEAAASTINYNIIHLSATVICFVITSVVLIYFYRMPFLVRLFLWGLVIVLTLLILLGLFLVKNKISYKTKTYKYQSIRFLVINIKLSIRRLLNFYNNKTKLLIFSLSFDVAARFIEGLTFYFGFYLIKHPLSLLSSSLMEVGRTFIDTIFFFVPYQIGSREKGISFFMEKILLVNSQGFLTAVFLYRFVEIVWMLIGYLLWVSTKSSSTDAIV